MISSARLITNSKLHLPLQLICVVCHSPFLSGFVIPSTLFSMALLVSLCNDLLSDFLRSSGLLIGIVEHEIIC